jgi:hypothetical protein
MRRPRIHIRTLLLLVAFACLLLWLIRDYPVGLLIVYYVVPPAILAAKFVEHLESGRKRLTLAARVSACCLVFVLSVSFLTVVPLVVAALAIAIIWLFGGVP